ncbi:MAG: ABC transporter ATP-binding protein [Dehalococcoidales bacterium]|nr:ABC transporter ATP-binding protein [Dehalococcoidales bacterium]
MLEVKEALKVYGEGEARVVALDKVSLKVNKGDYIAIMGPSGSGKSTLLNIIGGLDRISGGEVLLDGKRIDNLDENSLVEVRRRRIAYVFQQYHLLPSLTAVENVYMPLLFGGSNGQGLDKAMEFLKMVGLEKRALHKPGQLSGGEQQRVAIARAIIHNPSLILADEPTGNMDQKTGADILEVFARLNEEGRSIVMVTHSPEVARHAKEIVYLKDGRRVERVEQK